MLKLPSVSVAALAAAILISACTSIPEPQAETSTLANGSEVVTPDDEAYLKAFNVPRGPVRATQTGIRPGYHFVGIAETDIDAPLAWTIVGPDGAVVLSGMSQPLGYHDGSGRKVHLIETYDLLDPAEDLVLTVDQVGQSHPFDVADDVFRDLKYDTLRYFYHNRVGVPIEAEYAGGEAWARPAGHTAEVLTCFEGEDMAGLRWPGCTYHLEVGGGWYDAGDQSKYVVNSGITVWTLLNAYERGTQGFADGWVNIPESGNGLNDLLDEARFNLDYMLKMQAPEGAHAAVLLGNYRGRLEDAKPVIRDVSGMVHHKSGDIAWPSVPKMPHENDTPRALFPPSVTATLHVAAVGAQCARIFRGLDDKYADKCLTAARRAYDAAERMPDAYSYGNFTGSGPYGSVDPRGEFYWAAAELYITTGEPRFAGDLAKFKANLDHWPIDPGEETSWSNTFGLGILSLARFAPDAAVRNEAREGLKNTAAGYLEQGTREGYRIPLERGIWSWGSMGILANRGMLLGTMYDLTGDARYRDGALNMLDYMLGRNPRDISYVSGHGENAVRAMHHRHWAGAEYEGYPLPPPGAVSGGPNNTPPAGPVSRAIIDQCHAQTCFADVVDAYELNEVAINWQAASFWLAAWADDIDRRD